jgi:hypothetical protein
MKRQPVRGDVAWPQVPPYTKAQTPKRSADVVTVFSCGCGGWQSRGFGVDSRYSSLKPT